MRLQVAFADPGRGSQYLSFAQTGRDVAVICGNKILIEQIFADITNLQTQFLFQLIHGLLSSILIYSAGTPSGSRMHQRLQRRG
ncbi:hypothetical protein D3C79_887740 [compost metagenome]